MSPLTIARAVLTALAFALALPATAEGPATGPRATRSPAEAEAALARLSGALELDEVLAIMREEGLAYGADLDVQMLDGAGGPDWAAEVGAIYDTARLGPLFHRKLAEELAGADLAAMEAFFTSDLGRRIITLEVSARRALLDEAVEEASRVKLAEMMDGQDPRLDLIEALVEAGDLIESNVSGGLNSNLAFYRGMIEGGAFPFDMSEEEILSDVWSQEPDIRADTEEWLYSYLAMAYDPLSEAEIADYTAFSETPAGKELNRALFEAFNAMFTGVSRQLGRAVAERLAGQEL